MIWRKAILPDADVEGSRKPDGYGMTLTVTDLSVTRAGLPVLSGVSFAIVPGEALILRGPNGIGKTTLLRTVAGLQPAYAGSIAGAEDQIAYAAHADGLKPTFSARENLKFWAQIFGTKDVTHRVSEALADFDLETLADRPAANLSAGQKRRLGLARLSVTGRPIWIMDEPTVSLDTSSVQRFAEVVQNHLQSGGSAMIATHIDLGLSGTELDLTSYKTAPQQLDDFDGAFL